MDVRLCLAKKKSLDLFNDVIKSYLSDRLWLATRLFQCIHRMLMWTVEEYFRGLENGLSFNFLLFR